MAIGRVNGCPTNIRDWQVMILDRDYSGTQQWLQITGLRTLTLKAESETAEGSAGSDLWEEPYVIKRRVRLTLEGKRIAEMASGQTDPGQNLLDEYALRDGCQADACQRFTDPYGHAMEAEYIISGTGLQSDGEADTVSWDLYQVGEARMLPYKAVRTIALSRNGQNISALTVGIHDEPTAISVDLTPSDASNRHYRVSKLGRQYAGISDISESGFSVRGLQPGTATITVISMNGSHTAALQITAEE